MTHAALLTVILGLLAIVGSQEQKLVYCGRRLATALGMLCENGLMKRSDAFEDFLFPWIPEQRARSLSRGKRHFVTECCQKPCAISELRAYCA